MTRTVSDRVPVTQDEDITQAEHRLQDIEQKLALAERIEKLEARGHAVSTSWLNAKMIALIASLVATVVPGTTALQAWFKHESDLALAEQQQNHAMRMDYVKTVLSSEVAERDREARLRLLVAILDPNDPLSRWANNELAAVKGRIVDLENEVASAVAEAMAAKAREQEAQTKLAALTASAAAAATVSATAQAQPTPPARTTPRPAPAAVTEELVRTQAEATLAHQDALVAARRARARKEELGGASTSGAGASSDPLVGLGDL